MSSRKLNRNVTFRDYDAKEQNNLSYPENDYLTFSKSSSSSSSWGEDCETEATQRVKHEYDKMNNVLAGLETIPPNYDKDEYKLWIKTFPYLRSRNLPLKSSTITEDVLNDNKCDNSSKNVLKSAVIDDLLNKMCNKLTNASGRKITNRKRNNKTKNENKNDKNKLDVDFETLLRISPAPTYDKSPILESRRRSTHYIENTSNYLSSTSTGSDFASLPHLPQMGEPFLNPVKKNFEISRRKPKTRKINRILLPPIDVSLNQFRSISAIPLQQNNKCSSALSTKTNINFVFDFGNNRNASDPNASGNKQRLKGFY